MGGTKNSTSTSQQSLPGYLQNAYQNLVGSAQGTASQPYQAYTGGFTGDQTQAFQNIRNLAGSSDPAFGNASTALSTSMVPTHNTVGAYMNPFQQNVIDTMMDTMQEQNQRQQQGVVGNAIAKGAFGGNRVGVAQGELARQQKLADNQTIAGLMSQNYAQGLGAAQADKGAQLQAAQQYAGLGQTQMQTGLAQTGAQLGAGTQQQQFDYQQYLNKLAFPYQQQSWLSSIVGGLGPSAGGTTTETKPDGNSWAQLLGLGLQAASLSDERAKEDAEPVGKSFDGQTIYKYRYKGSPQTHLGFMAQEVKKDHPDAVGQSNGLMTVDYEKATRDAAHRGKFAAGGVIPYSNDNGDFPSYGSLMGGSPYANDNGDFGSYVPKVAALSGGRGQFPEISPDAPQQDFQFSDQMKTGASNIKSWMSPQKPLKLGYNLATGGVVPHFADGGGPAGTRNRADYRGLGGFGGIVPLRDDADMSVPMRPRFDPVGDAFAALDRQAVLNAAPTGPRPGAESEVTMAEGVDGRPVAVRKPQPEPPRTMAYAGDGDFDPTATLPPQSVERFADPVGVAPATSGRAQGVGSGVVPYTRGDQFVTEPAPGFSRSIPEAWGSLMEGKGLNLSPDFQQALFAAGSGMMASKRPNFLSAVGEGSLAGNEAWNARQALERDNATARSAMGVSGQELALKAEETAANIAKTNVETQKERYTFTATPYGIRVIDVMNPTEPQTVYWGGQLPDGSVATPAAASGLFSTQPENVRVDRRLNVPESIPMVLQQSQQQISAANENASGSSLAKQQLEDMRHELDQLPETGPLVPGEDFPSRLKLVKTYQTYMSALGFPQDEALANEIAAGENLNKMTIRLGQALASGLGSDPAASVVMNSIEAVPGGLNSAEGARRIIAALDSVNDRHIDYSAFLNNWVNDPRSGGSTLGAIEEFNRTNPPELYALKAYVPMEALKDLADPNPRPDPVTGKPTTQAQRAQEFNRVFGGGRDIARFVIRG